MRSPYGAPYLGSQIPFPSQTTPNHIPDTRRGPRFFAGWALLPMRLFLGITFVYAGVQKLTDPQFFHHSTPGYIGNQIIAFAHGSPLQYFLTHIALPHAILFGMAVALGEIAIGLGALFGVFFRLAAFFGNMPECIVLSFGELACVSLLLWLRHCVFVLLAHVAVQRSAQYWTSNH